MKMHTLHKTSNLAVALLLAIIPLAIHAQEDNNPCSTAQESLNISSSEARHIEQAKIALICVIGFVTFLSSILPWITSRIGHYINAIKLVTCFSAGVIISAGFAHLLPDATEKWNDFFTCYGTSTLITAENAKYPYAQVIAICTCLLFVWIDRVFDPNHIHINGLSSHHHHRSEQQPQLCPTFTDSTTDIIADVKSIKILSDTDQTEDEQSISETGVANGPQHDHGHSEVHTWLFFIAISLHSIFDGLGVGSENNPSNFWPVFIAVFAHKCLDGIALGIPIFMCSLPNSRKFAMLAFAALMTPLGCLLGLVLTANIRGTAGLFVGALLISLSAGTFFFIGMFELLLSGLADGKDVNRRMIMVCLGFLSMAILAVWE